MALLRHITDYTILYTTEVQAPQIWLENNSGTIGQLLFHPDDDSAVPRDTKTGKVAQLRYRYRDFANIVDILRNEKPLYLLWVGPTGQNGIMTRDEPVGEAE